MKKFRMNKFRLYCTCGAGWSGTVSGKGHKVILKYWNEIHAGEGHGPCAAAFAAKKRRILETAENIQLRHQADFKALGVVRSRCE
jgi:hypothetical protein